MNEEAQGQKASLFQQKFVEFYFRKPGLRWKIWLALEADAYSQQAQDICEQLFLGPLREGDYKHFRNIADAL
jgi:hypothetical protein